VSPAAPLGPAAPVGPSAVEHAAAVAWVVGGTRGIGAAVAAELAAQGRRVVVGARSRPDDAAHDVIDVDVTDDASVAASVERIVDRHGRLDEIVFAARTPGQGTFLTMPDAEWREAIDTKLLGLVRVARHALPELERTGGTLLALVGSAAAMATAGHPLGCINAAVRHAVRGLALEWAPRGVRVVGVSPGPTATPSLVALLEEQATAAGRPRTDVEADLAGPMFRNRLLRPEEVAGLVAMALGPHGALLNGTVLLADDGATGGCL
jgi:NAD(P)-dependent dehydrogenase (short-subunit alcohol dehydrogenase family)